MPFYSRALELAPDLAAAHQKMLPWIQAIFRLEAIARWAREAGAWDLAELTARQMLEHDAAYGGSHLAWALVAEHQNDGPSAARALAAAESYWSRADPGLPELALVRARRARTGSTPRPASIEEAAP